MCFLFINCWFLLQSAPENDILKVNIAADRNEKIHFQADYNLQAPKEMILGLKSRLPAITSAISKFAEKYGILDAVNGLKTTLFSALNEAFTISYNHSPDLGQLSILFRNIIVQYSKAIQQLLDAAVTFLRETKIKLPGMEETTLPEIFQQIKSSIAAVYEKVIDAITVNLKAHLSTVKIVLPDGDILTGDEILDYMEPALTRSVDMISQLDSLDVIFDKLGQALQAIVDMAQMYIDFIQSDFLDNIAAEINTFYTENIRLVKIHIKTLNNFTIDKLNFFLSVFMELALFIVEEFRNNVSTFFPTDSELFVNVHNGRLKMDISFPLYQ